MPLETAQFISDLNPLYPYGSDPVAFVDDHIRMVKGSLKNTFPQVKGEVTRSHEDLNNLVLKTGDTFTGPLGLFGAPTDPLHAATKKYVDDLGTTVNSALGNRVSTSVKVSAGSGLSGGGALSGDIVLALADSGVTAGTVSAGGVSITVDSKGRITGITDGGARTFYKLSSSDGTGTARTVKLTPGVWQMTMDFRGMRKFNGNNYLLTLSQSATVGSETLTASFQLARSGGAGYGRYQHGSDIAMKNFTVATTQELQLIVTSASCTGTGEDGLVSFMGTIVTLEKL